MHRLVLPSVLYPIATRLTPLLLPGLGQIYPLSDLSTSLLYCFPITFRLSSDLLIYLAHYRQQSFIAHQIPTAIPSAGRAGICSHFPGRRKEPTRCKVPPALGLHFTSEERDPHPTLPLSVPPVPWGIPESWGSHASLSSANNILKSPPPRSAGRVPGTLCTPEPQDRQKAGLHLGCPGVSAQPPETDSTHHVGSPCGEESPAVDTGPLKSTRINHLHLTTARPLHLESA